MKRIKEALTIALVSTSVVMLTVITMIWLLGVSEAFTIDLIARLYWRTVGFCFLVVYLVSCYLERRRKC